MSALSRTTRSGAHIARFVSLAQLKFSLKAGQSYKSVLILKFSVEMKRASHTFNCVISAISTISVRVVVV